jgi:hypothetical protein
MSQYLGHCFFLRATQYTRVLKDVKLKNVWVPGERLRAPRLSWRQRGWEVQEITPAMMQPAKANTNQYNMLQL